MRSNKEQVKRGIKIRLLEALVEIGQAKKYEDISITELCTAADIDRSSFYRYYNVKDDLLKELEEYYLLAIDRCSKNLWELDLTTHEKAKNQCFECVTQIAKHHVETRNICLFLLAPENAPYFRSKLKKLIDSYFLNVIKRNGISSPASDLYIADFISSGVIDLLQMWLLKNNMSIEEFATVVTEIVMLVLDHYFSNT